MATTLTVTLSETLQNRLSSTTNGSVGIWAVYFTDAGSTPHAIKLAVEGGNNPKPATEIALPSPYDGGKIYLLIQSIAETTAHGSPAELTFGPTGVIKRESDISWDNADTNQYRFDSFEVSLLGAAADAGNLTDVNVFGIPMSVEIAYPNGAATQTRGYEIDGGTIFSQIGSAFTTEGGLVHKYEFGPLATQDRLAAAPTTALATGGPGGASASDWFSYLESLGNEIASSIQIAGQYNGAATVEYVVGQTAAAGNYTNWHNPAFYSYALSYEKAPATIYSASSKLGAQPFESNGTTKAPSNAITVTDPNARHYTNNVTKVTFTDATAFSVFTAEELNATHTVVNVIDDSHYQIVVGGKNATTKEMGGGTNVVTAVPLAENPFSAVAGHKFFTVTDPGAGQYANEGAEVRFSGASAFAGFSAEYLNETTFTITRIVDATHYEVATATEAQTGTGGGASVAPTYVRPEAGTFVFTPEANSQVKGTIRISSEDLANSIYSTLGNAEVLSPDGKPYVFTGLDSQNVGIATTELNTGFNTEWGAFFVKLLTGFIGGYYGGTGNIANKWTGGPANVDLNVNWNFDPSYAFGSTTKTPWVWDAWKFGNGVSFDKYARIFFDSTNSYGNGYSDAVMSLFQQGGPLTPTGYAVPLADNPFSTTKGSSIVTVHDPHAAAYGYKAGDLVTFAGGKEVAGIDMLKPPVLADTSNKAAWTIHSLVDGGYTIDVGGSGATETTTGGKNGVVAGYNVPSIHLTLFDDDEPAAHGKTLAETQGYTPTTIFNSHAGPFVDSSGPGHSQNLELNFGLGIGQMRPASDLTVSLGFFAGAGPVSGESRFTYVKFDTTATESLFQKWTYDSAAGKLVPAGQAAPTGVALSVSGLPYATGVNWYQLVFDDGTPAHKRTYNIYLDAVAGHGVRNPTYIGSNQEGSVAIDGLAAFTGIDTVPQYLTDVGFNMFSGGTLSMNPALLELITDPAIIAANPGVWVPPTAPVLGTLSGPPTAEIFSNWGGSTTPGTPNADLLNVTKANLAFGWQGADTAWLDHNVLKSHRGVIGAATNKIGALNTAKIAFDTTEGHHFHDPVTAVADIDGKWITKAAPFSNGTYSAFLTEFIGNTAVGNPGSKIVFKVDVPTLDFAPTGGDYLQLDAGGGDTPGNWIQLQTSGSSLPNGTLLVYARDTAGNMLDRSGNITTVLADAVLARIGSVAFDDGTVMEQGAQSVYLPVGQRLHFAIETASNSINLLPGFEASGSGTLDVEVSGAFGTLNLTTVVNNTLSAEAALAGSQRSADQPWAYLTGGSTIEVDVQGSAWNYNTIHFVRFDVDAATGALSVGGVAYGNTDEFRAAVQNNWDPNFMATGGRGNFSVSSDWNVSSTGYYAPVLLTEGGDIFVAGTGNVDGMSHIRTFGQNLFGFEDLRADQNSDWDYNDLVMTLREG